MYVTSSWLFLSGGRKFDSAPGFDLFLLVFIILPHHPLYKITCPSEAFLNSALIYYSGSSLTRLPWGSNTYLFTYLLLSSIFCGEVLLAWELGKGMRGRKAAEQPLVL
jgi:hypothetical protein